MTQTRTVQDKTVEINGLRLRYRDWPNPGAPALVMLHGFADHARIWDRLAAALQDRCRVLAPDLRGHGESAWADDYTHARMSEDIAAFVDRLDLAPCALLGHSLGAALSWRYTAGHPDVVSRLVIVDDGPEPLPDKFVARTFHGRPHDLFDDREALFRTWRRILPHPSDSALREWLDQRLAPRPDGRWTWRHDPLLLDPRWVRTRVPTEEQWALLLSITCPTLVVRGAESLIVSREAVQKMAERMIDCRWVEIPASGHAVYLDNPDAFETAVRQFLTSPLPESQAAPSATS